MLEEQHRSTLRDRLPDRKRRVMSANEKALSQSREAWAALGDEFGDIGRRFRENYEKVSETAATGSEEARNSLDRAVKTVSEAVRSAANSIGESLRDPKIREETDEAGAALLRAVGVTMSELGANLQRDAERAPKTPTG
jgi:hypothetical protein